MVKLGDGFDFCFTHTSGFPKFLSGNFRTSINMEGESSRYWIAKPADIEGLTRLDMDTDGALFPESACEGFFVKKQPLYYIFTPPDICRSTSSHLHTCRSRSSHLHTCRSRSSHLHACRSRSSHPHTCRSRSSHLHTCRSRSSHLHICRSTSSHLHTCRSRSSHLHICRSTSSHPDICRSTSSHPHIC